MCDGSYVIVREMGKWKSDLKDDEMTTMLLSVGDSDTIYTAV